MRTANNNDKLPTVSILDVVNYLIRYSSADRTLSVNEISTYSLLVTSNSFTSYHYLNILLQTLYFFLFSIARKSENSSIFPCS